MNRFRKFYRLERRDRLLFCESFMFHLFVGLLLKIVPFRRIPRLFSSGSGLRSGPDLPVGEPGQQSDVTGRIKDAVQRAGIVSPWRNRCLVSALAGRCMLRRRKIGSELSLGVAKNAAGKLVAHAWLKSGDFELVEKRGSYTELFLF